MPSVANMDALASINHGMNEMGTGFGEDDSPQESADWIIAEIEKEAIRLGAPLHEFDRWALTHRDTDFTDGIREDVVRAHNRVVTLIRSRIEVGDCCSLA